MAVVFWLIDNCGFVIKSYCTQIHSIPIGNLSKEDVVLNKENHTAVFSYCGFTSTIYLNLFGDLGLKVFETLEVVKEDYMSRQFCLNRYTSYPDFDHYCATSDFPRDCAAERLLFLLNRDPSLDLTDEEILVEHLCDVFSRIFEYVNGFTGTHEFHPSDYDASSVHVQVRTKVLLRSALEDYGYLKLQYLNKKRGKTVTLRLDNKKAKQLLLEDYSKEELKMMYKLSKKRFYALKDCLEKKKHISLISFLFDPSVVTLICWTRPRVLRNWLKEKGHDVDSLFIGYYTVSSTLSNKQTQFDFKRPETGTRPKGASSSYSNRFETAARSSCGFSSSRCTISTSSKLYLCLNRRKRCYIAVLRR